VAAARQEISDALRTLQALAGLQPTLERHSLCGSAYKRLAMIERREGDGAAERAALTLALEAYARAETLARATEAPDLFYPALNRMALELVAERGNRAWKGFKPEATAAARRSLMDKARLDPDFWCYANLIEIDVYEAVAARHLAGAVGALLARFGSFAGAISAPVQELGEIEGLAEAGIAALRCIQAAALRLAREEVRDSPVLNNWEKLLAYLNAVLARERIEQFRILFLDAKNRLIADEAQAKGTVNHTPVYPREVVRRALELQATALILVHNHPSGDPSPSRADVEMTREVGQAATTLGIVLHDHLIIGNGRHYSFRREGHL
jgi:DNA repair protein RadC